jgi:hypothetical protein
MSCLFVVCLVAAHQPAPFGTAEVCGCAEARAADGRCAKCYVGYFALVRIESEKLFETLDSHGHEVVEDSTRCAACRRLITTGGYCEPCRMGYVNGKGYFGRLGYSMAKGHLFDTAAPLESCCRSAAGWCEACKRGLLGNREFGEKADFEAAQKCLAELQAAAARAATCEHCAMAMIADSRCHACKLQYESGKPVELSTVRN